MWNLTMRSGIPPLPKEWEVDVIGPRCQSVQPLDQPVPSEDTVLLIHTTLNSFHQEVVFL